jgi:hypothetical protein
MFAFEAFAGGEILVAAIEKIANMSGIDGKAQIYNSTLMAQIIRDGNWSTILAKDNVTFSKDKHQAITKFILFQLTPEGVDKLIQSSTELVYPMPTWDQRGEATSCAAAASSYSDDDRTTSELTMDVIAAILSLLVIFFFALIGYSIYFTTQSKKQPIIESSSTNPMAKSQSD